MRKIGTVLAILAFLAGIFLLSYPAVSNLYYEHQQDLLTDYYDNLVVETVPEEDLSKEFQACWDYNNGLLEGGVLLSDPFDETQLDPTVMPYAGLLNLQGDGSMGYITIPAIGVNLIIYHGVEEDVLQKGVGHLQGSSLPVGGTGSHCVLSAHTGLNNKKLFTDLDQLVEGDVFYIHVLGEVLAYQVDQIKVVLPHEIDDLRIEAEHDYVTLVTCTPYGINTHRLLVRGTRISYEEAQAAVENTTAVPRVSTWLQQYLYAGGTGLFLFLIVILLLIRRKKRTHRQQAEGREP